jgi:hypothetical protein
MMKKNMGLPDRIIRVVLATIPIVLYANDIISGTLAIVFLSISGLLLVTSLFRFCPLYAPFGINTEKNLES